MSIGALLNLIDKDEFASFSFANADHHFLIASQINQLISAPITIYILDPVPEFDTLNWLRRHQTAHDDINAQLNISGTDLTYVDFQDPEQRAAWARLHFTEHQQWAQLLGID